ncbi:MAG: lipase chaperone [Alteromonas stellipolaris]|uniref:lipase chaperone n=1 Tax=Alteromonas stellipolaris TaxID=233316 RepID=UPI001D2B9739|nr:lipase chaperone [Alteromonas stellipolaris]MBZ2161173.1 lipase chaperone [Alteromonas stellipolaris]
MLVISISISGNSDTSDGEHLGKPQATAAAITSKDATATEIKKAIQPVKKVNSHASTLPVFTLYFGVKDSFDRFIFANEGASENEVKALFTVNATNMYEPRSAKYAADVFTRYVGYKVALADTDTEIEKVLTVPIENTVTDVTYAGISLSDVEQKLAMRDTLRLSYFSQQEYEYLFSLDAAIDARALARLAIAQDRDLSREQKRNEIFGQLNALDEQDKAAFQPTLNMEKINQIKQKHADSESRYHAIAAEFGHQVAERFSALWETQALWQQRVDAYRDYQEYVSASAMKAQAQQDALATYRQTHFSNTEQKRLRVFVDVNL